MTLPDERYRAIKMAEQLLRDLCDPKKTPRVPKKVRFRAASALRHYPGSYDLQQLEQAAPHVVQQQMEPLHRMIAEYNEDDHKAGVLLGMKQQNRGR